MRGIKPDDAPIIPSEPDLLQLHKPHMGLDGKTPAEVAGVRIEKGNKWATLLKQSIDLK